MLARAQKPHQGVNGITVQSACLAMISLGRFSHSSEHITSVSVAAHCWQRLVFCAWLLVAFSGKSGHG